MAKDLFYRKMIESPRWKRVRVAKLKQQPYCEDCLKKGDMKGATEVHHITPVETAATQSEKMSLMFNLVNLMSLCHECHVRIHREMRVHTKETVKQRQKAKLESVMKTFFPGVVFDDCTPGGVF